MNRPLTEAYSQKRSGSGVWQSEISHRYVLGLYELQQRLITDFPHVLLENCASGGGRYDPGMLYYGSQFWCSDNTDALVRMRIQYGTSLVYPTRTIGAHISAVPNHLTGNSTRLRTRGFVAMCGTFGFELDLTACSQKDLLMFKHLCEVYLQIAPTVRYGDMYRLWHPFKLPLTAWMYVSYNREQAVVFAFSLNSDHWSNLVPRLPLQGLDPDSDYEITEPIPNNLAQSTGTVMVLESEGNILVSFSILAIQR
jgi:alpha-galactosidase